MLVVTDQASRGLGGQGGLPGPAEAEEKRDVGAVRVRVGRAMHWEHALRREQVVERGEDRLLDLARISRAADDHDPPAQVDEDKGLTARAVGLRIGLHRRQRHHREVRFEVHQLVGVGADEQVAREQAVPGKLRDDAHAQPVARVGAGEDVLGEHLVRRRELFRAGQKLVELRRGDRLVARMPPDRVLARRLLDEKFVLG